MAKKTERKEIEMETEERPVRRAPGAFKCLVKGCQNYSDAGHMVGPLCAPCDHMLRSGTVVKNGLTFIHDMKRRYLIVQEAAVVITRAIGQ